MVNQDQIFRVVYVLTIAVPIGNTFQQMLYFLNLPAIGPPMRPPAPCMKSSKPRTIGMSAAPTNSWATPKMLATWSPYVIPNTAIIAK